jgi:starch phosphorylase
MFNGLWPDVPAEEVPIGSVTNGVHAQTWTSPELATLYAKTLGDDWPEAPPEAWRELDTVSEKELARLRRVGKERLVAYARKKVHQAQLNRGKTTSQVSWADDVLDPDILTIGFARRFATYKRATLLFRDVDRLRRLLLDADRPVQLIFAGKAHPADEPGHHLLQEVAKLASELDIRHRLVLLEDYDISVARMLVQGCDVWLNTPLRPNEACGTSGMKVVFNGGLNCSILDGWWDEMYDPEVGWAIPSAETGDDIEQRNDLESQSVYSILERQIVPLYYRRDDDGLNVEWLRRVKRSIVKLSPQVESTRMLREYVEQLYEPAAAHTERMGSDDFGPTRSLVRWARHLDRAWPSVAVAATAVDALSGNAGGFTVTAQVMLGDLDPSDVDVQAIYGEIDLDYDLLEPSTASMDLTGDGDHPGWRRYQLPIVMPRAGNFGFTVRIVPRHDDVESYVQVGHVAWAPSSGAH